MNHAEDRLLSQVDRTLAEHAELVAALKQTSFLLSSCRLVITDDFAREVATSRVNANDALLLRIKEAGKP